MADARSTFCVVTTLETAPAREASFFVDELHRRRLQPGRGHRQQGAADWLLSDGPAAAAEALPGRCRRAGRRLCADVVGASAARVRRVLAEVGESFANYAVVATREAEQRAELAAAADVLVTMPDARRARQRPGQPGPPGPVLLALTGARRSGRLASRWPPSPTSPGSTPSLDRGDVVHLLRLVADWGMLADFCFADLLLYAPAPRRPMAGDGPGPAR